MIFTGYTSTFPSHLNELDVVLHTSIEPEPFGRVLIEAMSLEKAADWRRRGCRSRNYRRGKNWTHCSSQVTPRISRDALTNFSTQPKSAAEDGGRGPARLENRFHINTNIAATQDYYAAILERRAQQTIMIAEVSRKRRYFQMPAREVESVETTTN